MFIEEITRSILESGDLELDGERYVLRQSIRDFTIPSTLQDSLIARLDRLGSAKDVVLTASIIGREFSYELIEAISPVPQATLLADLERLVQSDLLGQRGAPPQSRYIFKHALIRDAAYQSVLKARKRELHQRIAEVLANRFPESSKPSPSCWRTIIRKQTSSSVRSPIGARPPSARRENGPRRGARPC